MFRVIYNTATDKAEREGFCVGFVPNYAIVVNTKTKAVEQANLQDVKWKAWSAIP